MKGLIAGYSQGDSQGDSQGYRKGKNNSHLIFFILFIILKIYETILYNNLSTFIINMGYYAEELDEFYRERPNGRLRYIYDI